MEKGIYGFVLRYSKDKQILITLITMASFPFLYASLQLPKIIVNDAIDGKEFPKLILGYEFGQVNYLLTLCAALLVLYLINGGFLLILNTYKNVTSERMLRRLRFMLYQRILRFPITHFQQVSQGELSSMIAGEVELIREFISDAISLPIFQGGTLLTILYFMFAQDPILGLAAIAVIPLQAYVIPKLQRKINLLGRERVERARKLSGRVSESVSGIRDIRAHNMPVYAQADFSSHLGGIYDVRYRLFRTKFFMKFLNVMLLKVTPLLFYSVGGVLIVQGEVDLGTLVAVLAAYSSLTAPWKELLRYFQRRGDAQIKYQQLVSSFELNSLLNEKFLEREEEEPEKLAGALRFQNVMVSDDDGTKLLDDVSFEVQGGSSLAASADSLGRDALAHTMVRLLVPDSGKILIGERNLDTLSYTTLGARIGYAGAESYIFEGTIGYNSLYGLKRRVPPPAKTDYYDYDEAVASGNSLYDIHQDWTDFSAANVSGKEELERWWYTVMRGVGLEDTLFRRALYEPVDADAAPRLPEEILAARHRITERLNAKPELARLVHPFNFEFYNPSASVAANVIFGEPVDETFSFEKFGENELVRSVLAKVGLEERFTKIGLDVAREMVSLFGDPDVDQSLLRRFSFLDRASLDRLKVILTKVDKSELKGLRKYETAQLISLTGHLIVERHRLGHIDEELQGKIVEARRIFYSLLPEKSASSVATYDAAKFNAKISMQCNLIMGRVHQQRANAEQQVNAVIREVLTDMKLMQDVVLSARTVQVGIGGQRLSQSERQSLALARSILKKPYILVLNEALGAHEKMARKNIRENIRQLLPDTILLWIDGEQHDEGEFDDLLEMKEGRVVSKAQKTQDEAVGEQALEAAVMPDGSKEIETVVAQNIKQEASALARVPLFENLKPANLKLLAFGSRRVRFKSGELLIREGEREETAFLILVGEVEVLLNEGSVDEKLLNKVGKNQLIGEIALLAQVPRTATVRAIANVEAIEIEKNVFQRLIEDDPKVAAAVARLASQRLADTLATMQKKSS